MQFLKKHYEKILLGVVLAGLIGVLVFMLFYIAADKADMDQKRMSYFNPPAHPLPDLDLTAKDAAVTRLQSPFAIDLETGNKVFNPFEWVKTPDNTLVRKDTKTGPQVAVVSSITPLYLVLKLDAVMTNELGARYNISVENQAAPTAAKRVAHHHYVSVGDKPNDTFQLLEVKGPPENPDALVLKIMDTGETAAVTHDKPFRRVDAYTAELRYDPEKRAFHGLRAGSKVSFNGTDYTVDEINQNEVILEDQSNQKKTPLPFAP